MEERVVKARRVGHRIDVPAERFEERARLERGRDRRVAVDALATVAGPDAHDVGFGTDDIDDFVLAEEAEERREFLPDFAPGFERDDELLPVREAETEEDMREPLELVEVGYEDVERGKRPQVILARLVSHVSRRLARPAEIAEVIDAEPVASDRKARELLLAEFPDAVMRGLGSKNKRRPCDRHGGEHNDQTVPTDEELLYFR